MSKNLASFEFIGRILFTTTFLVAIPPKIFKFEKVVDAIVYQGVPQSIAPFLLVSAIICILIGSLFFLIGKARYGSLLLLLFLIPTTLIFHIFPLDSQAFFMNLGLIGALIIFFNNLDNNKSIYNNNILYKLISQAIKFISLEVSKLIKK